MPEVDLSVAVWTAIWSAGLVLLGGLAAYRNGFLTVGQMEEQNIWKGLPFVWHFGMWGDFLIMTPLLAIVIGGFHKQWGSLQIIAALIVSFVATFQMHELWKKDLMQQAHIRYGQLTPAGWINVLYMTMALAIILLFFFATTVSPKVMLWVSAVLTVYLLFGTHIVLGLIGPRWFPQRPQEQLVSWLSVILPAAAMFGRTAWLWYR